MKKVKYPNLNDYDLSAYEELKGMLPALGTSLPEGNS